MNRTGLGISWNGQPVGHLQDSEVETVELPETYKIRGRWVPLEVPATAAFLDRLRECPQVEVSVDWAPDMRSLFSMGSEGEAWLYMRDPLGWKRILGWANAFKPSSS